MGRLTAGGENSAAAMRGQIVQRVLVDGWSPAQAAAVFDVSERDVVRWLAAYRRHGMASLREDAAARCAPLRWLRRFRLALRRLTTAPAEAPASAELATLVRSRDHSARRSRR